MKMTDIEVGKFYIARISGNLTIVVVTNVCLTGGAMMAGAILPEKFNRPLSSKGEWDSKVKTHCPGGFAFTKPL